MCLRVRRTCAFGCKELCWLLLLTGFCWWWCEVDACWCELLANAISWLNEAVAAVVTDDSLLVVESPVVFLCEELWWGWWYTETWGSGAPGNRLVRTQYLATEEAKATAVPTRRSVEECGILPTFPIPDPVANPLGYWGRPLWPAFTSYRYTFKPYFLFFSFYDIDATSSMHKHMPRGCFPIVN